MLYICGRVGALIEREHLINTFNEGATELDLKGTHI